MKFIFLLFSPFLLLWCGAPTRPTAQLNTPKTASPLIADTVMPKVRIINKGDSTFIKSIYFAGYKVDLYSTKMNEVFTSFGFFWKEPGKTEHETALYIEELAHGVFCFTRWYDRNKKKFADSGERGTDVVPNRLESYSDNGNLIYSFDIDKNNPYTRGKYPNIEHEFYYEAEVGFAPKEKRQQAEVNNRAAHYWTNIGVYETQGKCGYISVAYTLTGLNKNGAQLFEKTTLVVLDVKGNTIFELKNSPFVPWSILITKDKKYTVLNVGGSQNINDMSDKLSEDAVIFFDNTTKNEIYREYSAKNMRGFGGSIEVDKLICDENIDLELEHSDTTYADTKVIYDINNRVRYSKKFTKKERRQCSNYTDAKLLTVDIKQDKYFERTMVQEAIRYKLNNFQFDTIKF